MHCLDCPHKIQMLEVHSLDCSPVTTGDVSAVRWEPPAHCCPSVWMACLGLLEQKQELAADWTISSVSSCTRGLQGVQEGAYRGLAPGLLPLSWVTRCRAGAANSLHLVCCGLCQDDAIMMWSCCLTTVPMLSSRYCQKTFNVLSLCSQDIVHMLWSRSQDTVNMLS